MRPSSRKYPYIDFRPNREIGNEVLMVENLSKTIDGVKVIDNVTFTLGHDDKVAFVGTNELAITTFFRILLGRMLFAGEDGVKKVRVLSGGEKVRCLLSKMMISGANILLLDEPTNHLDMESITALNNGLIKFPGVILFASHDHQFVQTTANRIMEFLPNGTMVDKITTYDEYLASDEMARKRQVYQMIEEDN